MANYFTLPDSMGHTAKEPQDPAPGKYNVLVRAMSQKDGTRISAQYEIQNHYCPVISRIIPTG